MSYLLRRWYWADRWEKTSDRLCLWLARNMPARLRRWAVVVSAARAYKHSQPGEGYKEIYEGAG